MSLFKENAPSDKNKVCFMREEVKLLMDLLFLIFRCPPVGLRQWNLFLAKGRVLLLVFDWLFSTFGCFADELG